MANGQKSKITTIHFFVTIHRNTKRNTFFIPKEYTLIVHYGEEYNVRTTSHETILDLAFIFLFF